MHAFDFLAIQAASPKTRMASDAEQPGRIAAIFERKVRERLGIEIKVEQIAANPRSTLMNLSLLYPWIGKHFRSTINRMPESLEFWQASHFWKSYYAEVKEAGEAAK